MSVIGTVALVLAVLLALAFYILMRLTNEMMFLREELVLSVDCEHAKCMAAVMQFVGDEFAAQVLTVAADDYGSAEEQSNLARISRLHYQPGGPPVPTLWLGERAERLRIFAASVEDSAS